MLRFVKGTLRWLSTYRDAQAPKRITGLRCRDIGFTRTLQGKNQADQFPGGMRDGDIVMLAFGPFPGKVSSKGTVLDADVLSGVEEGIAKVTGAPFLHVGIGIVQFAGLIGRR